MPDNTQLNTPTTSGDIIATDDIAGVKFQRVKITVGADGVNDGDISSANPLPVSDGGGSLTVDGTVAATQSGTWNVNNISGTVSLPTGAATSAKQDLMITDLGSIKTFVDLLSQTSAGEAASASGVVQVVAGTTNADVAYAINVDTDGHQQVDVLTMPVVQVGDNGSSLTVDGTVAATQSGTWSTRTQDGSGNSVTSHLAGSSRGIDVSIIDGSGNQITSFGGGTQYADGAARGSATGTLMMGDDGTNIQSVKVDASGDLQVDVLSMPDSVIGRSATKSGNITAANLNIFSGVPTANSTLQFDNSVEWANVLYFRMSGTFSQTIYVQGSLDNSQWFHLPLASIGVLLNSESGSSAMNAISNFLSSSANGLIRVDIGGIKYIRITCTAYTSGTSTFDMLAVNSTPNKFKATESVNIAQLNGGSIGGGNGTASTALRVAVASDNTAFTILATGNTADDSPASGNPVPQGLVARTTNRTAVGDGDVVRAAADDLGRQVMVVGQVRDLMVHQHTQIASSGAETTVLTAGAAGVFHDITQIVLTNETATAVTATLKDATAGTTRMIIALAASGGAVIPFNRPMTQSAAANNWTITLSSAAVTVNVFVQAEKNV